MILVEYQSNNSGGRWWLSEKDWRRLEAAGWELGFYGDYPADQKESLFGEIANCARKRFESLKEALLEFQSITSQDVTDEGCGCCGAPHDFSVDGRYIGGGSDLAKYLYGERIGNISTTDLRAEIERREAEDGSN